MPFARLLQVAEGAERGYQLDLKDQYRLACFAGYQNYSCVPKDPNQHVYTYSEWCTLFGQGSEADKPTVSNAETKAKAERAEALAAAAFGRPRQAVPVPAEVTSG